MTYSHAGRMVTGPVCAGDLCVQKHGIKRPAVFEIQGAEYCGLDAKGVWDDDVFS